MRAFVIADASKRKARPVGLLFWEPDAEGGQGRFSLELSSSARADDLPLSLSFCASREGSRATCAESEEWVRSRIVPEDRHNIVEVLEANGLSEYDEVALLAACAGRSSDDDFVAREVPLPDDVVAGLSEAGVPNGDAPRSRADCVIGALEHKGSGPRVEYAIVDLTGEDARGDASRRVVGAGAAQRIGCQIRAERKGQGLTQKQLAARAGIAQAVLSRVESGRGNPTLGLLEEIAAALGMDLDVRLR